MADFGQPVAAGVQPFSQGLQTLSGLLGLKQQQIGIARQQIGLSQAQQQLSQETSQATQAAIYTKQLQNLSQIDWKQYQTPDGGYDIKSATAKALEVGGSDGPAFVSRLADMTTQGTAAKKALFSLTQEYQAPIRAAFGTWAGDPKSTVTDLAGQLEAIEDTAPESAKGNIQQIINHALGVITGPNLVTGEPKSIEQQKAAALAYTRSGLTPEGVGGTGGIATAQPGTVSTGTQILPTSATPENPTVKQSGAPVANIQQVIHLPNGQVATFDPSSGGYVLAGGTGKGAAETSPVITAANDPNRPSPNAPVQVQQQWTQAIAQANKDVSAARDADQYGNNMAIAQEVRALSHATNTGPGTPELTRVIGTITSRFGGSQGVTNTQTLESFLDRQAASMRGAMGLPATNLGAEESKVIGGNIGMQGGALRAKNDYNEALAQGLHDYRQGLDKIAGFGGNASPTVVNRFRSEWAKYFNPIAYEYSLAQKRGDRQLQDAIAKSVSPSQAKRMRADLEVTERLAKGLPP